jgi:hypothetical protein
VGTRRHALQPFTFSDGTKLNVGDWACVPVQVMMRNPDFYPEPLQFHGFRFVDWKVLDDAGLTTFKMPQPEGPSNLTDTEGNRHVWGTGRMTWYVKRCLSFSFLFFSRFLFGAWEANPVVNFAVDSPGRYYATAVMKVILAQVILNYDCRLVDMKSPRVFTWRSTTIPKSDTMVIFKLRKLENQ